MLLFAAWVLDVHARPEGSVDNGDVAATETEKGQALFGLHSPTASTPPSTGASLPAPMESALLMGDGWIGLRLDPPPGWHLYWENPGDSGLATKVTVAAVPEGMEVGEVRMPGPDRFLQPGGIVNYGWEDVVLLIPVRTSPSAPGSLAVRAEWLMCRDDGCVTGTEFLMRPWPDPNASDLSPWIARLPVPVDASLIHPTEGGLDVDLAAIEVFPGKGAEAVSVERADSMVRLRWSGPLEAGAHVVLRLGEGRYVDVALTR